MCRVFYFDCSFTEPDAASVLVSAAVVGFAAGWDLVLNAMLPSLLCSQLLCQLLHELPLGFAAGALLEEDVVIAVCSRTSTLYLVLLQ